MTTYEVHFDGYLFAIDAQNIEPTMALRILDILKEIPVAVRPEPGEKTFISLSRENIKES